MVRGKQRQPSRRCPGSGDGGRGEGGIQPRISTSTPTLERRYLKILQAVHHAEVVGRAKQSGVFPIGMLRQVDKLTSFIKPSSPNLFTLEKVKTNTYRWMQFNMDILVEHYDMVIAEGLQDLPPLDRVALGKALAYGKARYRNRLTISSVETLEGLLGKGKQLREEEGEPQAEDNLCWTEADWPPLGPGRVSGHGLGSNPIPYPNPNPNLSLDCCPDPSPDPKPKPNPNPKPYPNPNPKPNPNPNPKPKSCPKSNPKSSPRPNPKPKSNPKPKPNPNPSSSRWEGVGGEMVEVGSGTVVGSACFTGSPLGSRVVVEGATELDEGPTSTSGGVSLGMVLAVGDLGLGPTSGEEAPSGSRAVQGCVPGMVPLPSRDPLAAAGCIVREESDLLEMEERGGEMTSAGGPPWVALGASIAPGRVGSSGVGSPLIWQEPTCHADGFQKLRIWELEVSRPIVILGDSNLSMIPGFSCPEIQVDSFPGALLHHLRGVVGKLVPCHNTRQVVLSVGLNNCLRGNLLSTIRKQFQQLVAQVGRTFPGAEVRIPLIQFSTLLPLGAQKLLEQVNIHLEEHYAVLFGVEEHLFQVQPHDPEQWTEDTGASILEEWLTQLDWE